MSGACSRKSVWMITCTSDRSGIASSGVEVMAHSPAPTSTAVASRTRNRLRSDHEMIQLIMLVLRSRCRVLDLLRAVLHAGHASAGAGQPALGVHQEVGGADDGLTQV